MTSWLPLLTQSWPSEMVQVSCMVRSTMAPAAGSGCRRADDAQVVVQTELALVLLPPDAGATAAVKVEHHLAGTVARLLRRFVRLAQLNQSSISVGVVLAPELGFVVGREPLW